MRATRDAALVVAVALAVLVTVVVYRAGQAAAFSVADKDTLVIGVEGDVPGLGIKTPAGPTPYAGFEVDVATYVAGRLGVSGASVRFTAIHTDDWERALRTGAVDLMFASYPITPRLADRVTVAGPYYVAHQSILVGAHDESIKNVRDLDGKRLCQVAGDRAAGHITQDLGIAAVAVPAGSYAECVELLARGGLDAVSADDLILAGAVTATSDVDVKIVNAPFTDERYGVELKKGDVKGCAAVNRALTEMYQSGAANTMVTQGFAAPGLSVAAAAAPRFEGCA
jgi:glutamate transport system substrate-binding protein